MAIEFTPGLVKNDPNKARLYFRMFRSADAVAPASVTSFDNLPAVGMLGNDIYGDCVEAMIGHNVDEFTFYGEGAEYTVSQSEALAAYTTITGFNPKDPNTDQGTTVQDGLGFLKSTGFGGHKAAAFAQLDVTNMDDVKLAIAEFGSVSIGFNFPSSAMSQFDAGTAWDVVKHDGGIEGGHAVLVVGYDAKYLYLYTWGTLFKMTYAFWTKYVEEAWTTISVDWFNAASGMDPEGVNKYELGNQYAALTGDTNPFPAPIDPPPVNPPPVDPPPVDPPPVTPTPDTDPADLAFKAAVDTWVAAKDLS